MAEDAKESRQSQPNDGAEQKEKEMKKEEASKEAPKEDFQKEYQDALKSVEEWKNKYYLCLADTQNLRKDLEKDHQENIRFRAMGFLENLLPALDSFYIALATSPKDEEAKRYQQGFQYIYNQIESSLVNEGVSEILPKAGDKFDPTCMHAVDTKEADSEGLVLQIFAKGYRLHERLVRPAMVCVSKKKPDDKTAVNEAKKA
jgi:molecular chaperone GrpE